MPSKTPHSNGKQPVGNGARKTKDADVKDVKGKSKKAAKDADEEMTVVVPPSKAAAKQAAPIDADGDVAMEEDKDAEVKVDPAVQTVAGKCCFFTRTLECTRPLLSS